MSLNVCFWDEFIKLICMMIRLSYIDLNLFELIRNKSEWFTSISPLLRLYKDGDTPPP